MNSSKCPSISAGGWFWPPRSAKFSSYRARANLRTVLPAAVVVLCCYLAIPAKAQQQDPENERRLGVWFDQAISAGLSSNTSLEFEFHQRLDEGASNLFEYFFQGGMAFRLRPWLTLVPIYRYQRYPGDTTTPYENRLLLNLTLSTTLGRWRPIPPHSHRGAISQKSN